VSQSVSNGIASAWDFAFGLKNSVNPLILSSANTGTGSQTYQVELGQSVAADGTVILPLVVNGVLNVGLGSTAETVVITAVSNPTPSIPNTATFTAVFANAHSAGEPITSGSGGVQEAANNRRGAGGGLVSLTPSWFLWAGGHSAGLTTLVTYKSLSNLVTLLDYSGIPGVFSYNAAANSVYASTTHVLY